MGQPTQTFADNMNSANWMSSSDVMSSILQMPATVLEAVLKGGEALLQGALSDTSNLAGEAAVSLGFTPSNTPDMSAINAGKLASQNKATFAA